MTLIAIAVPAFAGDDDGWSGAQEGAPPPEEDAPKAPAPVATPAQAAPAVPVAAPAAADDATPALATAPSFPLPAVPPDAAPSPPIAVPSPGVDTAAALTLPPLSASQHAWLEPRRNLLPPDPRAHTDYTAYTLEWGEVRVGLMSISVGALPHVQVGTSPVLDALQFWNAQAKWDAFQSGPFDVAVLGGERALDQQDFKLRWITVGAVGSYIVSTPWSVHAGVTFDALTTDGIPDLEPLGGLLGVFGAADAVDLSDALRVQIAEGGIDVLGHADQLGLRFGTSWRFNRRDSVVLQATYAAWGDTRVDVVGGEAESIDDPFGLDELVGSGGSYTASVAWDMAWHNVELRAGVGLSSFPGAWLLQATEVSYRFGGPTRREEWRMKKTWQRNQQDVDGGGS
jgi:hypothetical protein